jgi:hypothetical protein
VSFWSFGLGDFLAMSYLYGNYTMAMFCTRMLCNKEDFVFS